MGIFSALFGGRSSRKHQMIDWAIKELGKTGSAIGTAYREIEYNDVIEYITSKNLKIIRTVEKPQGKWIEFVALIDGTNYVCYVDKTPTGEGAILTTRRQS